MYAAFSIIVMSGGDRVTDEVVAEIALEKDIDKVDVTWEMIAPKLLDASTANFMMNKPNWPVWIQTSETNDRVD